MRQRAGFAHAARWAGLAVPLWASIVQGTGSLTSAGVEATVLRTTADVHLVAGAAVTRLTQKFAIPPGGGLVQYRLTMPAGAEVTDLAAWAGSRQLRGVIESLRFAAEDSSLAVLRELAASQDGLTQTVGLDLPPGSAGELLVQAEYLEALPGKAGHRAYRLPLDGPCDTLEVLAGVHGASGARITLSGPVDGTVAPADSEGIVIAGVGPVALTQAGVLELSVDEPPSDLPSVLAWRPVTGDGYYAVWMPAPEALSSAAAPAVSLVVDLGRGPAELLAAARRGLRDLVMSLPEQSLLALAISGGDTLAIELAEASPAWRSAAAAALQATGAGEPAGLTDGLGAALRAVARLRWVTEERPHYLVLVTDAATAATDSQARRIPSSLADGLDPLLDVEVLHLAGQRQGSLASELAHMLGAPMRIPSTAEEVRGDLASLAAKLAKPHAFVGRIDLPGALAWDLVPPRTGWVPVGDEVVQMGRYSQSGSTAVRVYGLDRSVVLAQPVTVALADTIQQALEQDDTVLLHESFESGTLGPFTVAGGNSGEWRADSPPGVLCVSRVLEVARVYAAVPASSFTIEARIRVQGNAGCILLDQANRHQGVRLDMLPGEGVRVITLNHIDLEPFSVERGRWYDVRVTVGNDTIRTWVDGMQIHRGVSMRGYPSDGVIGLSAYAADSVFFDDVIVREGTGTGHRMQALLPDRLAAAPALLWAGERARLLERQQSLYGQLSELEAALLDVGLTFRVVTETSPLVLVVQAVAARRAAAPSAACTVLDSSALVLPDPTETRPVSALLTAAAPNPFNGSTRIGYRLSAGESRSDVARLVVYDMAGQPVRDIKLPRVEEAWGWAIWDGRDAAGTEVATGVYLYAIEVGGVRLAARRLALVR